MKVVKIIPVAELVIILFALIVYSHCLAESKVRKIHNICRLDPFVSKAEDRFVIGVPLSWKKRINSIDGGNSYMFWDEFGNAFSISVHCPNSFKRLLEDISKNKVSKHQLTELQKKFAKQAPLKMDIRISINTIANRKSLTQNYIYKHQTINIKYYMKNITYDLLYNERQYSISFSARPGATKDEALQNFRVAEKKYFTPMLVSFFLK